MAGNDKHIPYHLPAPRIATKPAGRWRCFVAAIPLRFALLTTATVWAMGCIWSFREQALFAQANGFHLPWLLPAVIDGLAIALACVAYAASLDGRPGVLARLGTAVAVAASAASNATFAWQRSGDPTTAVIAAGVPVAANLAFEVLLHELRRQVLRRRGLPAPAAVPYPRLIRVVLAPCSTLRQWRRLVLDLTALEPAVHAANTATHVGIPDAHAPARGVSASLPASASDASAPRRADASAPPTDAELLAPAGATAATADASAPRKSPAGLAPADAATAQITSSDGRQVIQSDACQNDAADTRSDADADADAPSATRAGSDADAEAPARATDASTLAEEARQVYRASVAAGDPLTGRQLGRMYNRSPSWGRERVGEVKSQDRAQTRSEGNRPDGPAVGHVSAPPDDCDAGNRALQSAA